MSKVKAIPKRKGMPPFVPTPEERQLVKLMAGAAYAHDRIAMLIGNRRGGHVHEATVQRAFAKELVIGVAECDAAVLNAIFAAACKGESWACRLWVLCRMNTPARGNWHERSEIALGGGVPGPNGNLPPVKLMVVFETADPRMKPRAIDHEVGEVGYD